MLYFYVDTHGHVTRVAGELDYEAVCKAKTWARREDGTFGAGWLNRNDIRNAEHAFRLAESATALYANEKDPALQLAYMVDDCAAYRSPKWDVVQAPRVGDEVSKGFNGDYYPQGKIKSISKGYKVIILENGLRFYRKGGAARWVQSGGTWALIRGVHDERNPHF